MPFSTMQLEPTDIAIHFETQDMLDAGLFAELMTEIVAFLRHDDLFGAGADVRIAEIAMGSLTVRFKINPEKLIAGAALVTAVATIGQAVPGIAAMMEDPDTKAGQCAATIIIDQSVSRIEVKGATCSVTVTKENRAVQALEEARALEAIGLTAETMDRFDELVNVKMPRALHSPGLATVQLQDLKKFERSELVFHEHIRVPNVSASGSTLYRARGVVRKRSDGRIVFLDRSDHATPIDTLDADWDVPFDRPIDIWFTAEANKPLPFRQLTVVQVDIV